MNNLVSDLDRFVYFVENECNLNNIKRVKLLNAVTLIQNSIEELGYKQKIVDCRQVSVEICLLFESSQTKMEINKLINLKRYKEQIDEDFENTGKKFHKRLIILEKSWIRNISHKLLTEKLFNHLDRTRFKKELFKHLKLKIPCNKKSKNFEVI